MPNNLTVEQVPTGRLESSSRNPRTHSKKQIRQIAASIREFGFVNPVLIDEANLVIAGHGRLAAARLLKLETVPAIRLRHLSEPQKRALALADNKLADNAGWNEELLAQELQFLSEIEVDFDVEITGFDTAEVDLLIQNLDATESGPRRPMRPAGTKPGTAGARPSPSPMPAYRRSAWRWTGKPASNPPRPRRRRSSTVGAPSASLPAPSRWAGRRHQRFGPAPSRPC